MTPQKFIFILLVAFWLLVIRYFFNRKKSLPRKDIEHSEELLDIKPTGFGGEVESIEQPHDETSLEVGVDPLIPRITDKQFNMQTKVLPFVPSVTDANPTHSAAAQLQELVDEMAAEGWRFVTLTSMQTVVKPTGCAAFGQNNGSEMVSLQLVVFQK